MNKLQPGILAISPADGLISSGNQGGAFTPASIIYTLENKGGNSINWTASKTQAWITLSSANGTLAAGGKTTVTVSVNNSANTLAAGSYTDTVKFTNTATNESVTRNVSLTVNKKADCNILNISPDQIVKSLWGLSCKSVHKQGCYAYYYTFSLKEKTTIQIYLESKTDTYLFLLEGSGKNGRILAKNDNMMENILNSSIIREL